MATDSTNANIEAELHVIQLRNSLEYRKKTTSAERMKKKEMYSINKFH